VDGQFNVRGPLLARGPVELSNTMCVLSDVAFGAKLSAFDATNLGSTLSVCDAIIFKSSILDGNRVHFIDFPLTMGSALMA
jgi:hypothetical protein